MATASIAVKHRQAWMATCLRHPSSSLAPSRRVASLDQASMLEKSNSVASSYSLMIKNGGYQYR